MNRSRRAEPLPRPPIGEVLKELGAEDVPTGFGWVRMTCPFCEDTNGSASVNHERGGFNCHQCDRRGDALKLLQNELGLTFREAVDRAKLLDPDSTADGPTRPRRRRASDLLVRGQ